MRFCSSHIPNGPISKLTILVGYVIGCTTLITDLDNIYLINMRAKICKLHIWNFLGCFTNLMNWGKVHKYLREEITEFWEKHQIRVGGHTFAISHATTEELWATRSKEKTLFFTLLERRASPVQTMQCNNHDSRQVKQKITNS